MKRVYVIDDEPEMTDSITMILEAAGFETGCQNSVANAVANLVKFRPDLILLDVMFPGNDSAGFELARELRKQERLRRIPILMLSGINEKLLLPYDFSNSDIDEEWMPISQFVDKPVNPQVLIDKVKALTGNGKD